MLVKALLDTFVCNWRYINHLLTYLLIVTHTAQSGLFRVRSRCCAHSSFRNNWQEVVNWILRRRVARVDEPACSRWRHRRWWTMPPSRRYYVTGAMVTVSVDVRVDWPVKLQTLANRQMPYVRLYWRAMAQSTYMRYAGVSAPFGVSIEWPTQFTVRTIRVFSTIVVWSNRWTVFDWWRVRDVRSMNTTAVCMRSAY